MSEMVERVAKAIFDTDEDWAMACPWGRKPEAEKNIYRKFARAAIVSMKGPTVAMVDAGYAVDYSPDPIPVDLAWDAMIDEAAK